MKFNLDEYKIMKREDSYSICDFLKKPRKSELIDSDYIRYYEDIDKHKITKIELLRANNTTPEFLKVITDKNLYNAEEVMKNLKNCLYNKNGIICATGPSLNEFEIRRTNELVVCIKTAISKVRDPDILIYNDRVYTGTRTTFDYRCDNKPFIIFVADYSIAVSFQSYVNNENGQRIRSVKKIERFPYTPNLILSPHSNKYFKFDLPEKGGIIFDKSNNRDNIIYGYHNVLLTTDIVAINMLRYMGIDKIDIYGLDMGTIIKNQCYHSHNYRTTKIPHKIMPYDIFMGILIHNNINIDHRNITIYSDNSNANYKIKRYGDKNATKDDNIYVNFLENKMSEEYYSNLFYEYNKLNTYQKTLLQFFHYIYLNFNKTCDGTENIFENIRSKMEQRLNKEKNIDSETIVSTFIEIAKKLKLL